MNFRLSFFEKSSLSFLILAAILLYAFVPVAGTIDQLLALPFVDLQGKFFLEQNWWLVHIGHIFLKNCIIAIAIAHIGLWLYFKKTKNPLQSSALFVVIAMAISISIIGVLKATSVHACPWSLIEVQGKVLDWHRSIVGHGKCFPGGHASAGFALVALFFAYKDRQPKLALVLLGIALLFGGVMSGVQMLRGAHFLSHNLWALWWSWAIDTVLYIICMQFPKKTLSLKE